MPSTPEIKPTLGSAPDSPAKPPVSQAATETGTATKPRLPLPHDRDESASEETRPPEPVMEQAGKDLARGLRDTDLRGAAAGNFDRRWAPEGESDK